MEDFGTGFMVMEMAIMEQERLLDWVEGYGKGDYGARKTLGFGTGLCKG